MQFQSTIPSYPYSMSDSYYNTGRRNVYGTAGTDFDGLSTMRSMANNQTADSTLGSLHPTQQVYNPYSSGSDLSVGGYGYNQTSINTQYIDPHPHLGLHSSHGPSYSQSPYPSISSQALVEHEYIPRHSSAYESQVPYSSQRAFQSSGYPIRQEIPVDPRCNNTHLGISSSGVVRNHICPTCGKGFGRPSSLAQHEFTHTGERPYVCTVCTKAFNTSSNLKRHQGLHDAS